MSGAHGVAVPARGADCICYQDSSILHHIRDADPERCADCIKNAERLYKLCKSVAVPARGADCIMAILDDAINGVELPSPRGVRIASGPLKYLYR